MAEKVKIHKPEAEATYRQLAAIGIEIVNAAYPDGLNRQDASQLIEGLRYDKHTRWGAIDHIIEKAALNSPEL